MKQRLVNFSFLVSGHIVQDIVITDENLSGTELVEMLDTGKAFTTVDDDGEVINDNGDVIGTVLYSDRELSFEEFQMESGEYEQENAPHTFGANRLAYAAAVGEFVAEAEELSLGDIHHALLLAGDKVPEGLPIEKGYRDLTGRQLLREIELMQAGLMNLMQLAYTAGKRGQEIV